MKLPVVLRIYKGDQLQGIKQFLEPQIVIGRPGAVQLALEGDQVSFLHASIEERDGKYTVSDLGSETGTLKNGEVVLVAPLESGDVLKIGEYTVEFFIGAPKPKAAPAASPSATTVVTPPPAPSQQAPPAAQPKTEVKPAAPTPPPPAPPAPQAAAEVKPPVPPKVEAPVAPPPPVAVPPPVAAAKPETEKEEVREETLTLSNVNFKLDEPLPKAPPKQATPPPQPKETEKKTVQSFTPPPSTHVRPAANRSETGSAVGAAPGGGVAAMSPGVGKSPRKGSSHSKKKHASKTFAPPSKYNDVKQFIKPTKGTVVEVLVAWRERVITTRAFSQPGTVTIGSHPTNDIVVPVLTSRVRKLPILKIDGMATVLISPDMSGELVRGQTSSSFTDLANQNRMVRTATGLTVNLEQGEMAKIELGDQVSVIIRYVSESPKPMVAPLFDLTTSEFAGLILSAALITTFWLYMYLYTPTKVLPEAAEEPMRTAVVILPKSTPAPKPTPPPPEVVEQPTPPPPTPAPKVVRATPAPKKVEVAKVAEKKSSESKPKQAVANSNNPSRQSPGRAANPAPNKNKTGPRQLTSPKQGGAIKTAKKEGSQMQSKSRDMSKAGIFSAFGGGGAQDKLAGSTTGSGELAGLANAATGTAGFAEDRPGQGLGSALKDTGRGGTGKSLEGIAGGIHTSGRGSGNSGYGTGGLGGKTGVKIVTTGEDASFSGTIDREAIRRVILANTRVIRTCYERQLNRQPDLFGKLVLSWEIGEQGRVVGVGIKSNELGNKEVAECILNRLRTWKFPEPPGNQVVEVAYPFLFSN